MLLMVLLTIGLANSLQADAPNVVLILADDLGQDDLGLHNRHVSTPNLDRLAAQSASFTNFYVHLKCAPSRASLLTGRHFHRTGVWGVHGGRDFLSTDETTIADVFQNAGYDTAMMGKWHSGLGDGYYPWQRGFDVAHMAYLYRYTGQEGAGEVVNGRAKSISGWAEQHFTDAAIAYVGQPRDRPYFLYLPYMSPHSPWRSPRSYQQPYLDAGHSDDLAAYWGMVSYSDAQIGRLLAAIDASGQADNTIIVFLSDNGPVNSGAKRPPGVAGKPYKTAGPDWRKRNPTGLRGGKGQVWENGVRSVLFMHWPGRIDSGNIALPASIEDLFPTLLDMAEVDRPKKGHPIDGQSLAGLLLPDTDIPTPAADRPLFFAAAEPKDTFDPWRLGQRQSYDLVTKSTESPRFGFGRMEYAVRHANHKLVRFKDQTQVFDLKADPREQTPQDAAEVRAKLEELGQTWWRGVLAEPAAFERPDIFIGDSGPDKRTPSVVQMRAATRANGVKLTAHDAHDWNRVGDRLEFDVTVSQAGTYRMYLLGKVPRATEAEFEIRIANAVPESVTARISQPLSMTHEHPIFGWNPEQSLALPPIKLPAGQHQLSITLKKPSAGTGPAVQTLNHLVFIRVADQPKPTKQNDPSTKY